METTHFSANVLRAELEQSVKRIPRSRRYVSLANPVDIRPRQLPSSVQCATRTNQDHNRRPDFKEVGHRIHDIQTALHRESIHEQITGPDDEPPKLLSHDDSHDPDHVKAKATSPKEVEMASLYPV